MWKKIIKLGFVLPMSLIWGFICNAQAELTLDQCKKMALEYHQSIKSAEAKLSVSEADHKISKRSGLPKFDFSGSYTYLNDPSEIKIPSFELPTIDHQPSGVLYPGLSKQMAYNNSYKAGVGMSLPLYMGGKINDYKKISGYGKQIAEENLVYEKSELIVCIDEKYWSLVSLNEKKLVAEKSVEFLTELGEDMQNRYEFELVTKNDVLKATVELNNAKLSLLELSNGIRLLEMSLNKLIGNNILDDIIVADSIVNTPRTISVVEDFEKSINNRSEIKIMENQMDISNSQLSVVKSEYKPQLISFANYQYQNPNHLGIDDGEFTWNAGVSLNIPIFHWGERKLKIKKQKMENRQIKLQYESTKDFVMLDIQQSVFKLRESLVRIEMTSESLKQAEENLNLETNRLDEGLILTTDLLNAQMQWQKSHADYIDAKVDYKISESNYYKSIGVLNY